MKNKYNQILEKLGNYQSKNSSISKDLENRNVMTLEKEFNVKLPKSYTEFIKEYGSIRFDNHIRIKAKEVVIVSDKDNTIPIDNFFDFSNEKSSVMRMNEIFKGNLPNNVLPICEGVAGDLVVIDLSDKSYGKVFYWHHEHEEDNDGLSLLANNFDDFLMDLFLYRDLEDTISTDDVKVTKVSDKFLERLKRSGKI